MSRHIELQDKSDLELLADGSAFDCEDPETRSLFKIKCLFYAIAFILFLIPCAAKEAEFKGLIPFEQNEKWGYINNKGKIIIKPQFERAEPFSEGLAAVDDGSKHGFINAAGKFVIEPQYELANSFSEGLAPVAKKIGGPWGYIDSKGNTIIAPRFHWAYPFHDGMAMVGIIDLESKTPHWAKMGYIDKTGSIIIEPRYDYAMHFFEGMALIADDKPYPGYDAIQNRKAFIDKKGNRVTDYFDDADSFSEGLAAVKINRLWGYIDETGTIVIPPIYKIAPTFSEGFAPVTCENGKDAFIDKKGTRITECAFESIDWFHEGLAAVRMANNTWGYVNTKGQFAIKPQFTHAFKFQNGLARVRIIRDHWMCEGYIDHQGKYVIKPVKKSDYGVKPRPEVVRR
jgi:hypothetical protein